MSRPRQNEERKNKCSRDLRSTNSSLRQQDRIFFLVRIFLSQRMAMPNAQNEAGEMSCLLVVVVAERKRVKIRRQAKISQPWPSYSSRSWDLSLTCTVRCRIGLWTAFFYLQMKRAKNMLTFGVKFLLWHCGMGWLWAANIIFFSLVRLAVGSDYILLLCFLFSSRIKNYYFES